MDQTARALVGVFILAASMAAVAGAPPQTRHVVVRKPDPGRAFGWPANGGIWNWGDEILVMYLDCPYKNHPGFSNHDSDQKHPSSTWVTSRSLDGGETWTEHRTAFPDLRANPDRPPPAALSAITGSWCVRMGKWSRCITIARKRTGKARRTSLPPSGMPTAGDPARGVTP